MCGIPFPRIDFNRKFSSIQGFHWLLICLLPTLLHIGSLLNTMLQFTTHSSLNSDLCHHGLVQTPKCAFGSHKEDVAHYFLTCPKYAAFHLELLIAVAHIGSVATDRFQNVTAKID